MTGPNVASAIVEALRSAGMAQGHVLEAAPEVLDRHVTKLVS
jgi:hypothetical protein